MADERRRYHVSMTEVTIGIPDDVRDELAAQAARSGRSLEEYLADELTHLARPPVADHNWVEQIRARVREYGTELTIEQILEAKDADRR
jgi:antitoxin FitA